MTEWEIFLSALDRVQRNNLLPFARKNGDKADAPPASSLCSKSSRDIVIATRWRAHVGWQIAVGCPPPQLVSDTDLQPVVGPRRRSRRRRRHNVCSRETELVVRLFTARVEHHRGTRDSSRVGVVYSSVLGKTGTSCESAGEKKKEKEARIINFRKGLLATSVCNSVV